MAEYYLIALTEPDRKSLSRILKLLQRDGINIVNIVITVEIRRWDKSTQGLLGAIRYIEPNTVLLKGILPLPRSKGAR